VEIRNFNFFVFLRSTKLAIVLLVLVLLFSLLGTILSPALGREIIFSSLWFNFLLILLIVNILFCNFKRIKRLSVKSVLSVETVSSVESVSPLSPLTDERTKRLHGLNFLSLFGSIIFHFSFVLLFIGVIYNSLFFFEGGIRLTEGESLSCGDEQNYDWMRKGRFFKIVKLQDLGEIYFHKLYPSYYVKNDYKGVANKIVLRPGMNQSGSYQESNKKEGIIYVNSPLKYKGFEFYQEMDGFSPLFVFRDEWRRVLGGGYAPLNAVRRSKGDFNYLGGFLFPLENPLYYIWSVYFPKTKNEKAKVFLEIKQIFSPSQSMHQNGTYQGEKGKRLFKGKVFLKEMASAGNFFISVDEIRFWSRMKIIYRPGLSLIFSSFWLALGGISLTTLTKWGRR
jgi:hypothetical protein